MSGLQYEEVMRWSVGEVLTWLQKNNLEKFRAFVVSQNIDGPSLIHLDKKRIDAVKEAPKPQKESLHKLLKDFGKEKEKGKKEKSLFRKGSLKGGNEPAAVPSNIKPPSARAPPPPPDEEEEEEFEDDPDEWDDGQGIYDNDDQFPTKETITKDNRPALSPPVENNSDDDQDYVNPDEELRPDNQDREDPGSFYEQEDTPAPPAAKTKVVVNSRSVPPIPNSSQRPTAGTPLGGRAPAPIPPPHADEFYEVPDQKPAFPPGRVVPQGAGGRPALARPTSEIDGQELYEPTFDEPSVKTAPAPPIPVPPPTSSSKHTKAHPPPPHLPPPPPAPAEDFYEETGEEEFEKVPSLTYEACELEETNAYKGRGVVPPPPIRTAQGELPEQMPPDRLPPRVARLVPPPIPHEGNYDEAEKVKVTHPKAPFHLLPGVGKGGGIPLPLPPQSPTEMIYEETEEVIDKKQGPPLFRGAQKGGGRPPPPRPTSEGVDDGEMYESTFEIPPVKTPSPPPVRGPAGGRRLPAPTPPTCETDDGDLQVVKGCELIVPPKSKTPAYQQTKIGGLNATGLGLDSIALRDVKGNLKKPIPKFDTRNDPTDSPPRGQPLPSEPIQRKFQAPTVSSQHKLAPGGPAPAKFSYDRAAPGAPPVAETVSLPSNASRLQPSDPNDISTQPWFFGDCKPSDAIDLLKKSNEDSTFLVRESTRSGQPYTLVIFFKANTFSIPVRKRSDEKFALGSEKPEEHVFDSVNDMVRFHRNNAIEVSKEGKIVGKVKLAKVLQK